MEIKEFRKARKAYNKTETEIKSVLLQNIYKEHVKNLLNDIKKLKYIPEPNRRCHPQDENYFNKLNIATQQTIKSLGY